MKQAFTIITIIFLAYQASSQSFIAESYLEHTRVNPKLGTSIGFNFKNKIQVGGFIQRSASTIELGERTTHNLESRLYGAFFSYPLVLNSEKFELQFKTRAGLANDENFVITPSIQGGYTPFKMVSIGAGIGVRSFRPTYMLTLRINLLGKKTGGVFASADRDNSRNN